MDKHELMGKRVNVHSILVKKSKKEKVNKYVIRYIRDFSPVYCEKTKGWVTGFRTIPIVKIEYEDGYPMPICISAIHVALVSFSPFSKPVYVPLNGFEVIND